MLTFFSCVKVFPKESLFFFFDVIFKQKTNENINAPKTASIFTENGKKIAKKRFLSESNHL